MSNLRSGAATQMAKSHSNMASPNLLDGPKLRTTLLISEDIDRMVEICAAVEGKQKSEIVNEALAQYLTGKDIVRSLSRK
jgi:hypothetical protein